MGYMENLRDLWKSPRGTVIRIEALALVAIALSFFTVIFGSCRRYSKHWIIQKGVLAANALSLSLGTYSIGLMQSSSVKSEMYPVWAASLLTLFGSVDSITGYSLDSNSQLLKLLFQLCLYCGYVLLIGISSLSSDAGNIAIGVLCAVTFIKGFHRSMACVLLSRLRNMNQSLADHMQHHEQYRERTMENCYYVVDCPLDKAKSYGSTNTTRREYDNIITVAKIWSSDHILPGSKDACLSFSMSHFLQRRFFGFTIADFERFEHRRFVFRFLLGEDNDGNIGYERAFKIIEVELAFLFDLFFTNNAFLHYYESKAATIWTFASITSIIFVGVTTTIPGTRTTRAFGGTVVVNTTTYDFIITIVILASLALVQVLQLIRCWTSNWARVALACQVVRDSHRPTRCCSCWMRLKAFLCRINWFEDNYLWRRKLGQYSLVESVSMRESMLCKLVKLPFTCVLGWAHLLRIFGSYYIQQVFEGMFGINTGEPVELSMEVKKALVHSLKRTGGTLTAGKLSLESNGARHLLWACGGILSHDQVLRKEYSELQVIMIWHIATCYCEMATLKHLCPNEGTELKFHLDVATILSRYCGYLLVSAPKLLPWHHDGTTRLFDEVTREATEVLQDSRDKYEAMRNLAESEDTVFQRGAKLGKQLEEMPEGARWKVMADFWADMMLFVAPSYNVKEHMEQLAQGGELITHLWALLSPAGTIDRAVIW